jgi:hypothetical protein
MGTRIQKAYGVGGPLINVFPIPILSQRAPTSSDVNYPQGQVWYDKSVSPNVEYTYNGDGTWQAGGNAQATTTVVGITRYATTAEVMAGTGTNNAALAADVFALAQSIVVGAVPAATETTAGIAEIATQAETNTGTDDARIVTPLKLKANLNSNPPAIGSSNPNTGAFTTLTATATGAAIALTSDTASSFGVTGAGIDLTLSSAAGRVVVNGEEAAADALRLVSAAGGLDVDVALLASITSTRNNAQAILVEATAGGIDILASGAAAGEDIDIVATGSSVNISSTESAADSITIISTAGGIDILASGAAAGEDIDIVATGSSVNISSTENVSDSIKIESTAGGIDILASGAAAGEDIDIIATGSSVNIESTEDAALAVYLHANGGTSETIRLRADQGTGVNSIDILSDVGGVTIQGGLGTADAINLNASNAAGGIDVDAGTGGVIVDTTGAISLDSATASNFTITGAADLTLSTSAGSLNLSAGEAAADAINVDSTGGIDVDVALQMNLDSAQAAATAVRIIASNAAGGIDVDAGTGGITIDTTGALSLDSAAASNFTVTGAFDLTVSTSAGSLNLSAGEDAADAIVISAAAGGIDILATGAAGQDIDIVNTGGSLNISATESAADSITIISTAGGIDILASGAAAGEDIDIVATGSSINITSTENVTDAIVINASGAASALQLDAGTGSVRIGTGLVIPVTAVNNAASPYTVLGTDYFLSVDTSAGAVTVTLPAATALAGRTFYIADMGGAAGANNITIGGGGTNLVGGAAAAATKVISANYAGAWVYSNGTTWSYRYVA